MQTSFREAMQGQITILGTPGSPLHLDERCLELANDPALFESLKATELSDVRGGSWA